MGKATAILGLLILVAVLVAVLVGGALLALRALRRARRAKARRAARWEARTELGEPSKDGAPLAKVSVQLIARSGHWQEVLRSETVAQVPVADIGDPALLGAQAEATARAELYNTLDVDAHRRYDHGK